VVLAGILAAWIAFQAQSFVSIDNLGLAIWGWVLGGTIVGLSYQSSSEVISTQSLRIQRVDQIDLTRVLTSGIATLLTVVLIAILYRGENNAFKASFTVGNRDQAAIAAYRDAQLKVIQAPLIDQSYSLKSAVNLIEFGLGQDGYSALLNLHSQDPRNLDVLNSLAGYHEFKNELGQAIMYREKIAKINPWNAVNYLFLGQDYKKIGNLEKSQEMLEKILSFAVGVNGGPIAEQAKKDLAQ
jgi:tetratricopeptide (TPR) repeat protein